MPRRLSAAAIASTIPRSPPTLSAEGPQWGPVHANMEARLRQLLIYGVATLSGTVVSPLGHTHCRIEKVAEFPTVIDHNQLLTRGSINGEPARILIDTGSVFSVIWRPAVQRLGLRVMTGSGRVRLYGVGGESRLDAAFVRQLQVAQFSANNRRFSVTGDLPASMDFILGEDLLARNSMEFDMRHHVVRMMKATECTVAELPYWAKTYSMADLIASPRNAQAIRVNVRLNGRTVRAMIDSGSSVSILSKSVADSVGLPYVSTFGELTGIGPRSLQTWLADVQSFAVGDETISHTQLRVAQMSKYQTREQIGSRIPVAIPNEPDMLLGLDFLQAHRILIDNSTGKMVFTYEGGPVFQTAEL